MTRDELSKRSRKYVARKKQRQIWLIAVVVMALAVSFGTTVMLMNGASAFGGQPICGIEEHEHTEECYVVVPGTLQCELPHKVHRHTGDCYDAEGNLTCDKQECIVIHQHDSSCYAQGELVCMLAETQAHTHDESCYEEEWVLTCEENHDHTTECYAVEKHLVCDKEEIIPHEHTDECYEYILTCEDHVHEHTEECYEKILACGNMEVLVHQHDDNCFGEETVQLACNKQAHIHSESCYEIDAEPTEEPEQIIGGDDVVTGEQGDVKVAVTYSDADDAARLPSVEINEIRATDEYNVLVEQAEDIVGTETSYARFFEISPADGETYGEPGGTALVTLNLQDYEEIDNLTSVRVIHYTDNGPVELNCSASQGKDLKVMFTTDSFSVFGVVYTVNYEYNGYSFAMKGGSKISLETLCNQLGLTDKFFNGSYDSNQVKNVTFSNPDLVEITKGGSIIGGEDWQIKSLKPFTSFERLTIELVNGVVISIEVTDDQLTFNNDGTIDLSTVCNQFTFTTIPDNLAYVEQDRDEPIAIYMDYIFTKAGREAYLAYVGENNTAPTLVYDFSSTLTGSPLSDTVAGKTIPMTVTDSTTGVESSVGNYIIDPSGKVLIEFTNIDWVKSSTNSLGGTLDFVVTVDVVQLGLLDAYTYEFPHAKNPIEVKYKPIASDASKTVDVTQNDDGSYVLNYEAKVKNTAALTSLVFTDTYSGKQKLNSGSVSVNNTPVSITGGDGSFSFDVASVTGSPIPAGDYSVKYTMTVSAEDYKAMKEGESSNETNKANWTVNGEKDIPGGETYQTIQKPIKPVEVTKSSSTDGQAINPGDTITYTITYGDANISLAGLTISDVMTDVQNLSSNITMTVAGASVDLEASTESTDGTYSKGNAQVFSYTFPEDDTRQGPVTVSYTTTVIDAVTAKKSGVFSSTDVTNTAFEARTNHSATTKSTVEYDKEPNVTVNKFVSSGSEGNNWAPGTELTYTLEIGDGTEDLSYVKVKDNMTDLQKLVPGSIVITGDNGMLGDISAWNDDGIYNTGTTTLFDFQLPEGIGNGPITITYKTTVISLEEAVANNIYGNQGINNTGTAGNHTASTNGTGEYPEYPLHKTAIVKDLTEEDGKYAIPEDGAVVHYHIEFGDENMTLNGEKMSDTMTDVFTAISDITITRADGTTITMPASSQQWAEDGVAWSYFKDDNYDRNEMRVFVYTLPNDIGNGPITIDYDATLIEPDTAFDQKIYGDTTVINKVSAKGHEAVAPIVATFPKLSLHKPALSKIWQSWDIENNNVVWSMTIDVDEDSEFPLTDVTLNEDINGGSYMVCTDPYASSTAKATDFDLLHADVKTASGLGLTLGIDYTIDKANASFHFDVINEPIVVTLSMHSGIDIVNKTTAYNSATVKASKDEYGNYEYATAKAEKLYEDDSLQVSKKGTYNADKKIVTWTCVLNQSLKSLEQNPDTITLTDILPEGLSLLNYADETSENPTVHVKVEGGVWLDEDKPAVVEGNTVTVNQLAFTGYYGNESNNSRLNGMRYIVTYKTKLTDEEWDNITSSETGSKRYDNTVTFTTDTGETYSKDAYVNISAEDDYIHKFDTTTENDAGIIVDSAGKFTNIVSYQVDINPKGYAVNYGKYYTLTDRISTNMELKTETVQLQVFTDGEWQTIEYKNPPYDHITITYNDDTRYLVVSGLPDKTPMRLVYSNAVRALGQDTFVNTATLVGGGSHSVSISDTHTVSSQKGNVFNQTVALELKKIDENNIAITLPGVEFRMWNTELNIDMDAEGLVLPELDEPDYETKMQSAMAKWREYQNMLENGTDEQKAEIKEKFKIIGEHPFTEIHYTNEYGILRYDRLSENVVFYWEETSTIPGYTADLNSKHYCVIYIEKNIDGSMLKDRAEHQLAAWILDDLVQYANNITVASMASEVAWNVTNVEEGKTSIVAHKKWEGDFDNLYETRPESGIKLNLYQIDEAGTKKLMDDVSPVTINVDPNGNWPSYTWSNLPSTYVDSSNRARNYKYTVEELPVDGYSATYSDNGKGVASGAITVTNSLMPKKTNVTVTKEFKDIDNPPQTIDVKLYQIIQDKKTNEKSDPVETTYAQTLSAPDWKYTWTDLPTVDAAGNTILYTVREDLSSYGDDIPFVPSYSDEGKGVAATADGITLNIVNKADVKPKMTLFKTIDETLITGTKLSDLQKNGITFTITGPNDYTNTIYYSQITDDPITLENLEPGEYIIKETNADFTGYERRTSFTANSEPVTPTDDEIAVKVEQETTDIVITNTYKDTKKGLSVKKEWKNADGSTTWPTGKEVTLTLQKKVGENEPELVPDKTITLNASKTSDVFEDLPATENDEPVVYSVVETPIDGYEPTVSPVFDNTITVVNTEKATDVTFTKTWDQQDSWPKDTSIKIFVKREMKYTPEGGEETSVIEDVAEYTLDGTTPEENAGYTLSVDVNNYLYAFKDLPSEGELTVEDKTYHVTYTYLISEESPLDYEPVYMQDGVENTEGFIYSGGNIINKPSESYVLPNSGGIGTKPFKIAGLAIILIAGMILFIRKKK